MTKYKKLPLDKAYRLIGHGPVLLISTRSKKGEYDVSPVAWSSPVQMSPAQILIGVGPKHKTAINIRETKEFIASVPRPNQAKLVRETGSVSGKKVDKFKTLKIKSFIGKKINAKAPVGCMGYLECKVVRIIKTDDVDLIIGECVAAKADSKGFSDRVLPERKEGQTLHHLGSKIFTIPSKVI